MSELDRITEPSASAVPAYPFTPNVAAKEMTGTLCALGAVVGATDGPVDGGILGETEGAMVGDTDGTALGMTLGITEGTADGSVVGATDVWTEGEKEGLPVGTSEGAELQY